MKRTDTSQEAFNDWFKQVDREIVALFGMGVNDLPDCCYRDWFEDGVSPKQAARRAIKNARGEMQ